MIFNMPSLWLIRLLLYDTKKHYRVKSLYLYLTILCILWNVYTDQQELKVMVSKMTKKQIGTVFWNGILF